MTTHLGAKVRTLRRREGMTQADLATKLEISASYLNLIEHNQRPLPAHLLVRVAQVLNADIGNFADDSSARLAGDLQEVFGDPLFQDHPLTTNDVRELAENTAAARAVMSLYHAYRSSMESTRALAGKFYDGRDFLGVNPAHLPSEEVSDVIQHNMNYFGELEAAADEVLRRAAFDRADMQRSLVQYLRAARHRRGADAGGARPRYRAAFRSRAARAGALRGAAAVEPAVPGSASDRAARR
jgi:transcriptional regulator with XRE-family HTH domain